MLRQSRRFQACRNRLGSACACFALAAGTSSALPATRRAGAAAGSSPVYGTAAAVSPAPPPFHDRVSFARALARVKFGMAREEVLKLLGKPDDIWTGAEINACRIPFVHRPGRVAWAYGGDGHLAFPTLGKVSFDGAGKAVEIYGHGARLPGPALPPEGETRRILRLMDRLKGYDTSNDPLRVIQVVNALQPPGKAGALALIDEYLRVADPYASKGRRGMFIVVRCLFEVPEPPGYLPQIAVGAPWPDAPKDLRRSPRFPVVLYRDIPLVGISGFMLGGTPERLESHLEDYRKSGTLRKRPLRPPDRPLEVLDGLLASPEWPDWSQDRDRGRSIPREQLLRLVDPVYRLPDNDSDERLVGGDQNALWKSHIAAYAAVRPHWDAVRNTYVRADGTFLPLRDDPVTYPRVWRVHTGAGDVRVELQRGHHTQVSYALSSSKIKPPLPLLRVFVGAKGGESGGVWRIPERGSLSSGFEAPEGSDVRLVLERSGKVIAQTVLRP